MKVSWLSRTLSVKASAKGYWQDFFFRCSTLFTTGSTLFGSRNLLFSWQPHGTARIVSCQFHILGGKLLFYCRKEKPPGITFLGLASVPCLFPVCSWSILYSKRMALISWIWSTGPPWVNFAQTQRLGVGREWFLPNRISLQGRRTTTGRQGEKATSLLL